MAKIAMGPQTIIYPMQTLLIGANVNDKPNFMAAAWVGVSNNTPPTISVAMQPHRYTLIGIRQNITFSVNVPSTEILKETDYCGITSGGKVNKVEVCGFKVFYGDLNNTPLIEQCPVNLECSVVHILNLGSHELVIGRVEQSHVSEDCMTDGKPDIRKMKPFTFSPVPSPQYHALGEDVARGFTVGKELRVRE